MKLTKLGLKKHEMLKSFMEAIQEECYKTEDDEPYCNLSEDALDEIVESGEHEVYEYLDEGQQGYNDGLHKSIAIFTKLVNEWLLK